MNKSERATARQIDQEWQEVKKRQESKALGKISQILVSIYDIRNIWAALKDGEALVLTAEGAMYKGHPNLDKLTKLQERYTADRVEHHFAKSDPSTNTQRTPYVFSANNKWDTQVREVNPNGTTKRNRAGKDTPKLDAEFV